MGVKEGVGARVGVSVGAGDGADESGTNQMGSPPRFRRVASDICMRSVDDSRRVVVESACCPANEDGLAGAASRVASITLSQSPTAELHGPLESFSATLSGCNLAFLTHRPADRA